MSASSANEIDIKYEPLLEQLPSECLGASNDKTTLAEPAVVNHEAPHTMTELEPFSEVNFKEELMEIVLNEDALLPIEEVFYDTHNLKPEEPCPILPPDDGDPLTDANSHATKSELDGLDYPECEPMAFVSLNIFECSRCRKTFANDQRLQLHLLECRAKDNTESRELPSSSTSSVTSLQRPCPANCGCAKCRHTATRLQRPSADDLRDVVERITLNHRRRAASPVEFSPPLHQCPCGQTFATGFHLKTHVRNAHKGKVPDFHPSYFAGLDSPSNCLTPNAIGMGTGLPGELITGYGKGLSYGCAVSAPSKYQNNVEIFQTEMTSSWQKAAEKNTSEGDPLSKQMEAIFKSVLKPSCSDSEPVVRLPQFVSKINRVDLQTTVLLPCSQCLKLFPTREILDAHFVRWHGGVVPPGYPCHFCQSEFPTLASRNTHTKTVHEPNDTFCSPISNNFDRLLQSQKRSNQKPAQAAAKSDGNAPVFSQTVTSTYFNKNFESNAMIGTPSASNLAQVCPGAKSEPNWASTETFGFGNVGVSSSAVASDPLNLTYADNPLRRTIANKINWIFNEKVANVNSDNNKDPLATPLNINTAKSTTRKFDNCDITKPPCDQPSIDLAPIYSDCIPVIISDSEDDLPNPLQNVPKVRKNSKAVVYKDLRSQNVVAHCSSGSTKNSKVFLVTKQKKLNSMVQPSNLTKSKHSSEAANVLVPKSNKPPTVKKTRQSADNTKPQGTIALAPGTSHNKNDPMATQGPISTDAQPSNPMMGPTRFDYELEQLSLARPQLRSAVSKGLQKVCYIDIEGNLSSMMTEDDNPSANPLYLCNICDAWFQGNKELVNHREENHVPKPTVKCKRCDKLYFSEAQADCHAQYAHIKEIHNEFLAAAAKRRKKMFAKFWAANERRTKREGREPSKKGVIIWDPINNNQGHYLCLVCNTYFSTKFILQRHTIAAHNKANFMCDLCGRLFWSQTGLKHHKLGCMKPETTMISCHKCDKKLSNQTKMRTHMATSHSNVRDFECDVCKKRFNQFYNLKFHIKTQHNGDRKYHTCLKCNKVFTALNSVRLHDIAAHQAFDCNFCDVTVIGKAELRDHVTAKHRKTDGNKFACGTCQKTFISKNSLVTHISIQHGIGDKVITKKPTLSKELIFCDVCRKAYVIKASMVRHMSVKHGFVNSYFVEGQRDAKKARKRRLGTAGKKSGSKKKAKKAKISATNSVTIATGPMSADVSVDSVAKQAISDEASQNNSYTEDLVIDESVVESPNSEIIQAGEDGENPPAVTHGIDTDSVPIDFGALTADFFLDSAAIEGTSGATFQNIDAENAVVESCNSETNQAENECVIPLALTQGSNTVPKVMRRSVREKKSTSNFIEETNTDFIVHMIDLMCKRNE